MSIISGLGQTPVYRLRSTWRQVSKHVLATLEELRQLLESSKNFAKYREILCGTTSPCVPFLDGIPNTTSSGMINFTKRRKTAKVIQEIQQYQTVPYALQPVPELQDYIICNIQAAKDVHEMYNRSLEIEPTENGEEDILGSPAVNHMSSVVIASLILR
ncbi:hypothetical protein EYZ11_007629 [Aspergillus tanneri]|uniref:Ras-GEF domain-containing protein n=1 Tax=Aspergillus tanneri TaxID=1220188 RepID=A0A4S3JCY1_9EURO|nr:hypothetical protein EYZ11_007629 [Aspergillus tanneri]